MSVALLYAPCISFMAEWFVARRGLANGTIFCGNSPSFLSSYLSSDSSHSTGTAVGGLVLPIVQPKLISAYGTSATLRILGIAMAVIRETSRGQSRQPWVANGSVKGLTRRMDPR